MVGIDLLWVVWGILWWFGVFAANTVDRRSNVFYVVVVVVFSFSEIYKINIIIENFSKYLNYINVLRKAS